MNPNKVRRDRLVQLTDLPNIGPAMAADLQSLGIRQPDDLCQRDPYALYERLCEQTGQRHDPCVIDVFISVVRFMAGEPAQAWWAYTAERKQTLASRS
jgi:hypothetical protein